MIVARLQWRTGRFELIALLVATLAGLAGVAFVVGRLLELAPAAACAPFLYPTSTPVPAQCGVAADFLTFQADWAGVAAAVLGALPIAAGVLLGSQLVARELERGSAVLAWSLDVGRRRWFIERTVVAVAPTVAVGLVSTVLSYPLMAAAYPALDIGASFATFDAFGPVLLTRGVLSFALGLAIGSLGGRTVPSLLATAVLAVALVAGTSWLATTAGTAARVPDIGGLHDINARYLEYRVVGSGGQELTYEQARALAPSILDPADISDWVYSTYDPIAIVLPGSEAGPAAARELALDVAGAAAAIGLAWLVVRRRRPA